MTEGAGAGDPEGDDARPPDGRDTAEDPDGSPEGEDGPPPDDAPEDGPGEEPGTPARHPADETIRTDELPDAIRCPHCGEEESEQFSSFGSAVSVSQYYCRSCRTVFEAFRWR